MVPNTVSEPIRKILACNIKKYRNSFRYSQEKLAQKAGLSKQTLNDIEGCRRWVSSRTITRLARALNIDEYQLLLPETDQKPGKELNSSLQSLFSLKEALHHSVEIQFDNAMEMGGFE